MKNQRNFDELIKQASRISYITQQIDFEKIKAHEPSEVEKLNNFLSELGADLAGPVVSIKANTAAVGRSSEPDTEESSEVGDAETRAARQMAILEQLKKEGFADRLGRLYNNRYESRSMEFRKAPHRKNLPDFDMIVAADYAPGAGAHGIIITQHQVMSVYLAAPEDQNSWQILKQRSYDSMEEMGEIVTLLAAGFDLP